MVGVTARDVMSRDFVGVSEGDDVDDVLELLVDERADDALVLRGGEPVGVVTCHDLLEAVAGDGVPDGEPVEAIATGPPEPVGLEADLELVLARLSGAPADALPVTDGDEVVGVVTEGDVVAAASSLLSTPSAVEEPPTEGAAAAGTGGASVDAGNSAAGPAGTAGASEAPAEAATQSVCESCGTLAGDLQVVNGQAICPECRDV